MDFMERDFTSASHQSQGYKNCASFAFPSMVTRLLTKKDPEFHSTLAKAATKAELDKLLAAPVWDMKKCEEWGNVKKRYSKATVARVFPILGLKHSESDNPTFKARIVLQGSDVRDAFNQAALFMGRCLRLPRI